MLDPKCEHYYLVLPVLRALTKEPLINPSAKELRTVLDDHKAAHCQEWACRALRAAIERDELKDDVASIECILRAAKRESDDAGASREACLCLHACVAKGTFTIRNAGQDPLQRAFATGLFALDIHRLDLSVQQAGAKLVLRILETLRSLQDAPDPETPDDRDESSMHRQPLPSEGSDKTIWTTLHVRGMRNALTGLEASAFEDARRAAINLEIIAALLQSKNCESAAEWLAVAGGERLVSRAMAAHQVCACESECTRRRVFERVS